MFYPLLSEGCLLRILATADFHGDAEAFQKTSARARQVGADIVLVCGDITHFGTPQQAKELLSILDSFPVLFVPGNCDPPDLAESKLESAECLHGKCKSVDSLTIIGLGGSSPSPFDTPFELSESEIASLLEHSYSTCQTMGTMILMSHSPPRNTKLDLTYTDEHVGSSSVRKFIESTKPDLVLCGHIHEAVGVDEINRTTIVNPGPARHGYYAAIDIDKSVNVKLGRL
jgi:Icc-related predicted phosphoesterase